ncbi:MAG: ATP-binding protein [Cyanobacteria bacterium J06635_15]
MKLSSLFQKTLIGQIILFGLIAASMSVASAYSLRWYLTGEYTSKGSAIAKSVAGSQSNLTGTNAPEILQTIIDEFAEVKGVAYVVVLDADGNSVAHTFETEVPSQFIKTPIAGIAENNPQNDRGLRRFTHSPNFEDADEDVVVNYRRGSEFGYTINIAKPIQNGDAGIVHVGMNQALMIQQIRAAIRFQLLVMALLFGISVLATYLMANRISRPLNQLTDYAERLAARDFSASVNIRSHDEIGLLARTMETMATDTQSFINQLECTLEELKQTQAQLIQSAKMSSLGQLVAGMAHEINNPVNFIAGNIRYTARYAENLVDLLKLHDRHSQPFHTQIAEKAEDVDLDFIMEDFPKVIASMQVGAERIGDIIKSLQSFSRLDQAELKTVNLHDGLDSTLLILSSRLKKTTTLSAINVVKQYGDLPTIECYAGQLNQVFMNVIGNAIDALEDKRRVAASAASEIPTLTLQTRLKDDAVEIQITDNGCGISDDVRQRLFDPFFTTKAVGEGTGLGLSISYQIVVQRHGGQIDCLSELDQGSTFVISIPMAKVEPDLEAMPKEPTQAIPVSPGRSMQIPNTVSNP